jgi:hypothetical protein
MLLDGVGAAHTCPDCNAAGSQMSSARVWDDHGETRCQEVPNWKTAIARASRAERVSLGAGVESGLRAVRDADSGRCWCADEQHTLSISISHGDHELRGKISTHDVAAVLDLPRATGQSPQCDLDDEAAG